MFARFGRETRRVIELAEEHARDLSRAAVGPEHLLLALLVSDDRGVFEGAGLCFDEAHDRLLEATAGQTSPGAHRARHLPMRLRSVFRDAFRGAASLGSPEVTPMHLALALTEHPPAEVALLLRALGVKAEEVRDAVLSEILDGQAAAADPEGVAVSASTAASPL